LLLRSADGFCLLRSCWRYALQPLFQGRSPSGAGFSRLTQSSAFGDRKGGGTILIATMESNRRTFMKAGLAAAILPQTSGVTSSVPRKGRIQQSVSRWCYKQIPLDQLCVAAAQMGLKGVDLLEVAEFEIPRRYGLICTMGYAGGGTISDALNRTEHHAAI